MAQRRFLTINDKHLAYLDSGGDGTPLLLIHGVMVSGEMYQPVLPALAAHHRIIAPDPRGHGHSGTLPRPYHVEQLAHDLLQLLDDLQVDAVDILGYSQGGAVAQQVAHNYPKRVHSLTPPCTFAYNMLSRREQLDGMISPWLVRILGVRRWANSQLIVVAVSAYRLSSARWLEEIIAANDKVRMVVAIKAMNAFDGRSWLHEITCPTLVIAGAEDEAVSLTHAQMLAQDIPYAQLRMVDGAGHFLIFTHTDNLRSGRRSISGIGQPGTYT